jgi:replicative DNA helicase
MSVSKKQLPGRHISDISLKYAKHKPTRFYLTGIEEFDKFTGGLPTGEMTIIAARPGDGKTALAMQVLEHIGEHHAEPSGIFSIEMNGRSLVTRMVLSRTGLPSVALRKGELTEKQKKIRDKALGEIGKLPIYIEDSSIATIPHIERTAKQWIAGGIKFLALDYIQLMSAGKMGSGDTRANFVGECARALKRIAKDGDVPFLVLSQLNRDSTKMKRKPTSADLKESGDLEQVADNIVIVHPDRDNPPYVDLILDKWRNGPKGIISTQFDSSRTRFESVKEDE